MKKKAIKKRLQSSSIFLKKLFIIVIQIREFVYMAEVVATENIQYM